MDATELPIRATAVAFFLLPPFLLGLAAGLWCWRIRTSILAGLVVGLLAITMPLVYQSQNPMVIWRDMALKLSLFLVLPAALGGFFGPKVRSRSMQRYPVVLALVFFLFGGLGYMLLLPPLSAARPLALQRICTNNLKQIGTALSKYAQAHDGHVPTESGAKGLNPLVSEGLLDTRNLICPWDEMRHPALADEPLTEDTVSYVYKGSLWQSVGPADAIPICWDKIENHRSIGVNVLFKDGHVQWMRLKEWKKIEPDK